MKHVFEAVGIMRFSTYNLILYSTLVLVFLVGGALQFVKIIRYTELNVLITFILLVYSIVVVTWRNKIDIVPIFILILFLSLGVLSAFVNKSDALNLTYFLIQVFLYCGVYYFIQLSKPKVLKSSIDFLYYISLLQLPIIILQRAIYPILSGYITNTVGVSYRDIGFGTFSLAEDHILGLLLILMLLLILTGNYLTKNKPLIIAYLSTSILATNSKISIIVLIVFGGYYLLKTSKALFILLLLFGIISYALLQSSSAVQQVAFKFKFIKEYLEKDSSIESVTYRIENLISTRKDVVIYFLNNPISWFGMGPGAYHNYKTNELFNGHFGQSLWYYRDFGLIGLLLSYLLLYIIKKRYPSKISRVIFIIAIIYSFFANLFFSLAFLLLYNIILKHNRNNESTNHSIPRLA